jgi:hypothetical protein
VTTVDSAVAVTDEVTATVTPRNSRTETAPDYDSVVTELLIDPERLSAEFAEEIATDPREFVSKKP